MLKTLLTVEHLVKRFGGLTATDDVSLSLLENELHAIIGPNGAGKTTLIAQLAGELAPDAGVIRLDDVDITFFPAYRRASYGLARSFQTTNVFLELTALENVAIAVQAHAGHSFRFWKPAYSDGALLDPAMNILRRVGLDGRETMSAGHLSHGERRVLEIAMALALRPRLLLLDEPMAGMGTNDAAFMLKLLHSLKGSVSVLLVEHDMDAVFALADTISVLVYGHIIATNTPAEIRNNARVREAYLGEESARG